MIKKAIILQLLVCFFSAKAQTNQLKIKSNRFGVFAGIGLTNAFENNTNNIWRGQTQKLPYKFISKPSFDIGINYKIPVLKGYSSIESELSFSSGSNIQNFDISISNVPGLKYINQYYATNVSTLAVFDLPLIDDTEILIFGLGPTIFYSLPDSKTFVTNESIGQSGKIYVNNLITVPYSNKVNLGAKAFIGISIKHSVLKFNYNYLKLNSDDNLLPIAPFYTLGITYEHKIF